MLVDPSPLRPLRRRRVSQRSKESRKVVAPMTPRRYCFDKSRTSMMGLDMG
ncbi:MAG: hypothetical protein HY318_16415 [Armatimonadetes bacterium]|nr:hypothetical protein [Armatimonadota bacterium]